MSRAFLNNSMCKVRRQADSSTVWDQESGYTLEVSDSEGDMKEASGCSSDLVLMLSPGYMEVLTKIHAAVHLCVHVPLFILYFNKSLLKMHSCI